MFSTIEEPEICEVIPLELTNSNSGQGHKWFSSAKERVRIERLLIANGLKRKQPLDFPVFMRLTRILGPKQRLWDATNFWRGNAKQLVDAMVALNWFKDDGPKYIFEPAIGVQDPHQRDVGPATKIELFRASNRKVK